MKTRTTKQVAKGRAFTIVELLTVMAVIALLIGLLVPALNLVRRHAKDTQQRAQFNAIAAGLELFRADNGDYPRSEQLKLDGTVSYLDSDTAITTGAQHLAEALIGRDFQGYDPKSTWSAAFDAAAAPVEAYVQTPALPDAKASLDRRKGPYLDIEKVGAFNIDQIYTLSSGASGIYGTTPATVPALPTNITTAPFLCDVYADRTGVITFSATVKRSVAIGTPILYFKSNPGNRTLLKVTPGAVDFTDRTYNYWDNANILKMGRMLAETAAAPAEGDARFHPMANDAAPFTNRMNFYDAITNPQVPNAEGVAVRNDTYILMSAGRDGLFGTSDDIYNFGSR